MYQLEQQNRQTGLSLVELMIALVISCFLILGVTTLFANNKQTYNYQQNQAGNQENSRFALLLVSQQLAMAGYRALPQDDYSIAFPASPAANGCPAFSAGQFVQPSSSGRGVCFRYQAASATTDCLGRSVAAQARITTRLEYNAANSSLDCSAQGATGQLVTGLSGLQFQYGIDLTSTRQARSYMSSPVADASIVAVRYSLLFASTSNNIATGSNQNKYFFPLSSNAATTPSDGRIYRSVAGTTTLRNIAQ